MYSNSSYLRVVQRRLRYEVVVIGALVGHILQVLHEMHHFPVHPCLQALKRQRGMLREGTQHRREIKKKKYPKGKNISTCGGSLGFLLCKMSR